MQIDDLTKLLVLNPYIGFNTCKFIQYECSKNVQKNLKNVIDCFIKNANKKQTIKYLLKILSENDISFFSKFDRKQKNLLVKHINFYLDIIDPSSKLQINTCDRYTLEKKKD